MTFDKEQAGDITIVRLGGQVDSVKSIELEALTMNLIDGDVKALLLDCAEMDYINSAGLRVFLLAAKRMDQRGLPLAFCGLVPNVQMIFETIGFDRILTVHISRDDALNNMRAVNEQAA